MSNRVASQDRIAAGIGGVVLVYAGEETVHIIQHISHSEVTAYTTVRGLNALLQIAKKLGAPLKSSPRNSELKMFVSEFDFNGISGVEILHRIFMLRDINGNSFSDLPITLVSSEFAENVKTYGAYAHAKLLVVNNARKPARGALWHMKWRCSEVIYKNAVAATKFLPSSDVKIVLMDLSVLMKEEGEVLLAEIKKLNITLVVSIPNLIDPDEMNRVVEAGALMIVVDKFVEGHSVLLSSLMG